MYKVDNPYQIHPTFWSHTRGGICRVWQQAQIILSALQPTSFSWDFCVLSEIRWLVLFRGGLLLAHSQPHSKNGKSQVSWCSLLETSMKFSMFFSFPVTTHVMQVLCAFVCGPETHLYSFWCWLDLLRSNRRCLTVGEIGEWFLFFKCSWNNFSYVLEWWNEFSKTSVSINSYKMWLF